MKVHENTGIVYLTSETPDDLYLIGRIAGRIKAASVYGMEKSHRELQIDIKDVVQVLAGVSQ